MKKNLFKGISFTVGASLWWGIIGVIYFKFVSYASPLELTIHRTIWTALLLILTTSYYSKWKEFNKIIKSKEAVYSLTSGLNQKIMNKLTDQILNNLPNFNEWIETSILNKYKFKGWKEVVKNLHSPSDENIKNKNSLRRRLAFDELLSHQLAIGIMRNFNQKKKGLKITGENKTINKFYNNLDFKLNMKKGG